jgi:hypothetical protein
LILIAIGVIFLLSNLGIVSGDIWQNLVRFWPLLLIAIGLDSIYRGEGLVGAAFMIGVGTVFLLANLGYLALDVWSLILRLWPLLLVAIGFDIIIGRRSWIASVAGLGDLALLAGRCGCLAPAWAGPPLRGADQPTSQGLSGQVAFSRAPAACTWTLCKIRRTWLPERSPPNSGQEVSQDFSQDGDEADYTLRQRVTIIALGMPPTAGTGTWAGSGRPEGQRKQAKRDRSNRPG